MDNIYNTTAFKGSKTANHSSKVGDPDDVGTAPDIRSIR